MTGAAATDGPVLRLTRIIARWLVRTVFRISMKGVENVPDGGVLIVGNHTGFLDGPLLVITLLRPSAFLAKSELFVGPLALILRWARQIPVHRGTPDRAALHEALEVLSVGGAVGMFPEGTRGEGQLESIQDGVGYLAARFGGPVVPVVCRGTAHALPKGKLLPRWHAPIEIVFGPAFTVPGPADGPLTRADIHAAADTVAKHLRLLLETDPQ